MKRFLGGYRKRWLISPGTTGQELLTSSSQILRLDPLPIHPTIAKNQSDIHKFETAPHLAISRNPTEDLDPTLLKAAGETGADLVVMQSHIPVLANLLWSSNGSKIARLAKRSVEVACN
jgi:hypothetical protein